MGRHIDLVTGKTILWWDIARGRGVGVDGCWARGDAHEGDPGCCRCRSKVNLFDSFFLRRVLPARKRHPFCAQSDPLVKRIIFHKNFKKFYKKLN